ncbi:MAG: hypothetical protein LQ340_006546 [Diploschistes diacapsis]|nr:MAG: hypothetical protein LQ340_006546 [Diploschistes diacapsis]
MALSLSLCTDEDMPRFFAITSDGFGTEHEYFNVVFPKHTSPSGRAVGACRFLGFKHNDPSTTLLKVTDTATGEMIGAAKWNIYDGIIPPEEGLGTTEFWETEEQAQYADALFNLYLEGRRKAIRGSNGHVVFPFEALFSPPKLHEVVYLVNVHYSALDILSVDPKHQYRGAGRMLVEWGCNIADSMDVESQAVVEASVQGRHLYETCGFVNQQFVTMEPPDQFRHLVQMKQTFFWMVRPKKSARAQNVKAF